MNSGQLQSWILASHVTNSVIFTLHSRGTNSLSVSSTTNTKAHRSTQACATVPPANLTWGLTHYQNHSQHLNTAMNQCTSLCSILIILSSPSIPKNFLSNNLSRKLCMLFLYFNTHTFEHDIMLHVTPARPPEFYVWQSQPDTNQYN
jgi:hypothetical protein